MRHRINSTIVILIILGLIAINYTGFKYTAFIPGVALILGLVITNFDHDTKVRKHTKLWSSKVLSYAVILLGFGFNMHVIWKVGISGVGYTVISIGGTLILGLLLGRFLKIEGKISTLISCGTAICGGSAIAAIAPIIKSDHEQTAISMGTIFVLNGVGLILFPIIGHKLHLSQHQFGVLAALAIHDTSSVVGSCMIYGSQSLITGTTIKLVRALWIIPVSLIIAVIYSRMNLNHGTDGQQKTKIKLPWFILWFICASLVVTFIPDLAKYGAHLKHFGESLFMVALFLIGYNVSISNIKSIGVKVFGQAAILWVIVSILVILSLKYGLIGG